MIKLETTEIDAKDGPQVGPKQTIQGFKHALTTKESSTGGRKRKHLLSHKETALNSNSRVLSQQQ